MKLKRLFIITAFIALAIVTVVFALFLVDLYLDQQRAERAERAERARRARRAEVTRNYGPEAESVAEAAIKIAAEAEATAIAARIVASKASATVVDHYKGEIRYGKPHGKEVLETIDTLYEGEWSEGKRHGKGVFRWVQRKRKISSIDTGRPTTTAIRMSAGDAYAGEWVSARGWESESERRRRMIEAWSMQGDGKVERHGQSFSGRTGKGVYRWANGDSWAGKFRSDKRYGKGIYRFKGGKAEIECFEGDSVVDCERL